MDCCDDPYTRFEEVVRRERDRFGGVRIVLINCPLSRYELTEVPKYDTIFPFGLISLARISREMGVGTVILDAEAMRLAVSQIGELVSRICPEVVGINLLSPTVSLASEILDQINVSHCLYIGGGPHATLEPEDSFERVTKLDMILPGEAENAWTGLCKCLIRQSLRNVAELPGVWRRKNISEKTFPSGDADIFAEVDRDSLVFPYYSLHGRRETSILASRGCGQNCYYCAGRVLAGGRIRFRQLESLFDEIGVCFKQHGITSFHFADDDFLSSPDYLKAFSDRVENIGFNLKWRSFARADRMKLSILSDLRRSGCYRLTFGIESGSPKTLRRMNKGHTMDEAATAVRLCHEEGIETKGFFMLGYPGETRVEMEETIQFALSIPLDQAYFYLVRSFPGTRLQRDLLNSGYTKQELMEYVHWYPDINLGLSSDELAWKNVLERTGVFRADAVLKYNVAHQRSINEFCDNHELMEIMARGYQRFYYRRDYVKAHCALED